MKYHTPLTPEQRRDVDDLIKYTEAHRRPLRKPRTRKRDPHSAPRPVNCFLVYRREKQAQIAELCTGANHRMISKVVAKWWKKIDDATRDIYVEIAKQVKQEHLIKFPNYKYTPK
ncbi:high mobility group box domain-containing protein, partial [Chlamydoabsidia padenii]